MGKYFGTDGIRGVANERLDASITYKAGLALAHVLKKPGGARPRVLIGRDTRISGMLIESAFTAGLLAGGADMEPLGVIPTPGVAWHVVHGGYDAGVVISASHNPFEYNGIKIFSSEGYKLPDALEQRIEDLIDGVETPVRKTGAHLGRVLAPHAAAALYCEHLKAAGGCDLSGLRLVFDCAHGAASHTAHAVFSSLGAECTFLFDRPDGQNINAGCGSTDVSALCAAVTEGGYDLGVAFDGDADRCAFIDERGRPINGDTAIALLALREREAGTLTGGVVLTILSNLGVHAFLNERGIKTQAAQVGDRYVLELMRASGANLGGEQSGHIIFSDHATTGDGQLSALKFLALLKQSGKTASELASLVSLYPQQSANVPMQEEQKRDIARHPAVLEEIARIEALFGGKGRVVIRPSGTEALVRVMVEGQACEMVSDALKSAVAAVERAAKEVGPGKA